MIATPQMLTAQVPTIPPDAMHALRKRERRARLSAFACRLFRLDRRVEASHMEAARDAREARLDIERAPVGVCVFDVLNGVCGSEVTR